jgi:hypothetical protein
MNPKGVKSATPILNDSGELLDPLTATPAPDAPL